jgi:hypothetical protein
MKIKQNQTNAILWQSIQNFTIDDVNASFPFSKKLAKEQKWSTKFTQKAIQAYKKFMYLCCVSPNGASPSKIVDEVWHLHLTYTFNYWDVFCANVLQQKIHHFPTDGSIADNKKYKSWEQNTLHLYEKEFGEKPPSEIWLPDITKRKWFSFQALLFISILSIVSSSCKTEDENVLGIGISVFVIVGLIIKGLLTQQTDGNTKNNNGNSCASGGCGGIGGCGSGCGGGCGGCGS